MSVACLRAVRCAHACAILPRAAPVGAPPPAPAPAPRASCRRGGQFMPWKTTMKRARRAQKEGKRPTTVAGEFVREEMEHVRRGKHGARSPQQAIAIGLSKARRAGVPLPPPKPGRAKEKTIRSAKAAARAGRAGARRRQSAKRSRAISRALAREPRSTASRQALSRHARSAAQRRRRRGPATPGARPLKSQNAGKGRSSRKTSRARTATGRKRRAAA